MFRGSKLAVFLYCDVIDADGEIKTEKIPSVLHIMSNMHSRFLLSKTMDLLLTR